MGAPEFVEQNPWWRTKQAIDGDRSLQDWGQSKFKWEPRLGEMFQWNLDVIYSLRGPRQVGKTTLIKLKIRELIGSGIEPRRIFFWACDMVDSHERLKSLITQYIDWARAQGFVEERLYIFLDEISSVRDWQKAIKFLFDTGKLRNCTLVLTGSHSIDLRKATESLTGRRGEIEKLRDKMPDKILLPMKFAEYAESRNQNIRDIVRNLFLLSTSKRLSIINQLAQGEVSRELEELQLYFKDLQILFDDYLITGGVPRAINSYLSSGTISRDVYGIYVDLLLRDIRRWGGNEIYLRQILQRIIETFTTHVSWHILKEDTEVSSHNTAGAYADILRDSFVISYIYQLNRNKGSPFYGKEKKIHFCDPFIFHALKGWVYGREPYQEALNFVGNAENRSKLVEGIVCNHLIRLLFNIAPTPQFDFITQLFYWMSRKNRELDFAMKLGTKYLPIEVKFQSSLDRKDTFGVLDFLKGGLSCRGVILTKDSFKAKVKYIELPVALFLMLV